MGDLAMLRDGKLHRKAQKGRLVLCDSLYQVPPITLECGA